MSDTLLITYVPRTIKLQTKKQDNGILYSNQIYKVTLEIGTQILPIVMGTM